MALADIPSLGGGGQRQGVAKAQLRVLLVEDDSQTSGPLVQLLAHYGYTPRLTATVRDALREVESWRPDVLLLDLMLPDGNGIEVLQRVRQANSPCRVAILTAVADERVLAALTILRPERVFVKPTEFLDIKAWIG